MHHRCEGVSEDSRSRGGMTRVVFVPSEAPGGSGQTANAASLVTPELSLTPELSRESSCWRAAADVATTRDPAITAWIGVDKGW
jgi:hypothetical protein